MFVAPSVTHSFKNSTFSVYQRQFPSQHDESDMQLGGFSSQYFPVRPLIRVGESDGAWLVAHKAGERRKYNELLMKRQAARRPNQSSGHGGGGTSGLSEQDEEPSCLDGFFLLRTVRLDDPSFVCHVDISGRNLSDVKQEDLSLFDSVTSLKAGENLLRIEPLSGFPNLRELEMPFNGLRNLRLTSDSFPNLEFLDVSYNELTKEDLFNIGLLKRLRRLHAGGNGLSELPEDLALPEITLDGEVNQRFQHLECLMLDDNRLSDPKAFASLAGLRKLKVLSLEKNEFEGIPALRVSEDADGLSVTLSSSTAGTSRGAADGRERGASKSAASISKRSARSSRRQRRADAAAPEATDELVVVASQKRATRRSAERENDGGRSPEKTEATAAASKPTTPDRATSTAAVVVPSGGGSAESLDVEDSKPKVEVSQEDPKSKVQDSQEDPKPKVEDSQEDPKPKVEDSQEDPKPKVEDSREDPKPKVEDSQEDPKPKVEDSQEDPKPKVEDSQEDPKPKVEDSLGQTPEPNARKPSASTAEINRNIEQLNLQMVRLNRPASAPLVELAPFDLREIERAIGRRFVDRRQAPGPAPFPALRSLNLGGNRVAHEEALVACGTWPALTELLIHDNPLCRTRSGELPLVHRLLTLRLGVRVTRQRPQQKPKPRIEVEVKPSRRVVTRVPRVPKVDVDRLLLGIGAPPPRQQPAAEDQEERRDEDAASDWGDADYGGGGGGGGVFLTSVTDQAAEAAAAAAGAAASAANDAANDDGDDEEPDGLDDDLDLLLSGTFGDDDDAVEALPQDVLGSVKALQYLLDHPITIDHRRPPLAEAGADFREHRATRAAPAPPPRPTRAEMARGAAETSRRANPRVELPLAGLLKQQQQQQAPLPPLRVGSNRRRLQQPRHSELGRAEVRGLIGGVQRRYQVVRDRSLQQAKEQAREKIAAMVDDIRDGVHRSLRARQTAEASAVVEDGGAAA